MNLTWTHSKKLAVFPGISREMYRYCDLGKIIRPSDRAKIPRQENEDNPNFDPQKTIFSFELEVKPNSLPHLIEAGLYRLLLLIGCANAKPRKATLEIDFSGNWYDDESKMFADGVRQETEGDALHFTITENESDSEADGQYKIWTAAGHLRFDYDWSQIEPCSTLNHD